MVFSIPPGGSSNGQVTNLMARKEAVTSTNAYNDGWSTYLPPPLTEIRVQKRRPKMNGSTKRVFIRHNGDVCGVSGTLEVGHAASWWFSRRDLLGMVSSRDPFKGLLVTSNVWGWKGHGLNHLDDDSPWRIALCSMNVNENMYFLHQLLLSRTIPDA